MSPAMLKKAFDLVASKDDWRAPIDAYVAATKLHKLGLETTDVAEAIGHYTATSARWYAVPGGWRFKAAGYRAGPAGP